MLGQAFCGTCMRTVYRGPADEDACPVCSWPLVLTKAPTEVRVPSPPPSELIPENEELRLAAVGRYEILDSPPNGAFDRISNLAARIFGAPISTITIVDQDRIWFKSKYGLDAEETGRDPGLCASAILDYQPLVVSDALKDPRALNNPLVRGDLGLRFYAGAPLTTADGYNLGTLNIIDTEPREMTDDELDTLKELANLVVDEMELRLAAVRLYRTASDQGVQLGT